MIKVSKTGVYPTLSRIGISMGLLFQGKAESAISQLNKADIISSEFFDYERILIFLIDKRMYNEALRFGEFLLNIKPSSASYYYTGIAYSASGNLEKAVVCFIEASKSQDFQIKAEKQLNLIEAMLKNPNFSRLRDRKGRFIKHHSFSLAQNQNGNDIDNIIRTLNFSEDNLSNFITLSIDYEVQNQFKEILKNREGVIIILDIKNGDIIAAFSNMESLPNPLESRFPPGNLMRFLVYASGIETGISPQVFPINCGKDYEYMKFKLYGNKKNQVITNYYEAFIIDDCPAAAAETVIKIDRKKMDTILSNFYCNKHINIINKRQTIAGYEMPDDKSETLAKFSTGNYYSWTTPLHCAFLAALIGSNGNVRLPGIIISKATIEGKVYYEPSRDFIDTAFTGRTMETLKSVMIQNSKTFSETPNLSLGVLTTSSGGIENPFINTTIGFIPSRNPSISFCVILSEMNNGRDVHKVLAHIIEQIVRYSEKK